MREVSPGALQVQPVMIKKVVKLLSNLGSDVVFGKRRDGPDVSAALPVCVGDIANGQVVLLNCDFFSAGLVCFYEISHKNKRPACLFDLWTIIFNIYFTC